MSLIGSHGTSAAVPLYLYQTNWVLDSSLRKIANKARQLGYTWATTLELVLDCIQRKTKWYYLTTNEARAKEAIEYVVMHCLAIEAGVTSESRAVLFDGAIYNQLTVTFPNGSKIIGLPCNPKTARGASGNVVLDEFAHHMDAAAVYQALQPVTLRGYRLIILSTPNGQQGAFYDLWTKKTKWSHHEVTLEEAVRQGLDVNVSEVREDCLCEDDWLQEYCCVFLDEAMAWLPYSLIEAAHSPKASIQFDSTQPFTGSLFAGVDVGRRRDLFVLWLNEQLLSGKFRTRGVVTLSGAEYEKMSGVIHDAMPFTRRLAIDENGIGNQMTEELVKDYGENLIMPVPFSNKNKAIIAGKMKREFEKGNIEIPDDADIRKDLHMVRRQYTSTGQTQFDAPRTKEGHADRFWACGLSLHAADDVPAKIEVKSSPREDYRDFGGGVSRRSGTRDWSSY